MLWFPGLEPEEDVREGGGLLRVHGARVDASGILGGKHPRETERWKVKQHFQKLWYLFLLKVYSRSQTMEGEKQTDHYYTFPSLSLKCSSTNSCCCRLVNTLTGESLHCCNIGRTVTRVAVLCVCVGKYWQSVRKLRQHSPCTRWFPLAFKELDRSLACVDQGLTGLGRNSGNYEDPRGRNMPQLGSAIWIPHLHLLKILTSP